jgi:hypothetical protein
MKYKTLESLQNAIKSGELKLGEYDRLTIDNDSTYLYVNDEKVFEMHPAILLEKALELLSIPWDNA